MLLSGSLGFGFNSWDIQFSQASIKKWVISPLWWRWDGVLLGVLLGSPVKFAVRHYYIVCMLAFNRGWTMSSSANVRTWIVFHWNTHITCHTARGDLGLPTPSSPTATWIVQKLLSEQQTNRGGSNNMPEKNKIIFKYAKERVFYLLYFLPSVLQNNIRWIEVECTLWSRNESFLLGLHSQLRSFSLFGKE